MEARIRPMMKHFSSSSPMFFSSRITGSSSSCDSGVERFVFSIRPLLPVSKLDRRAIKAAWMFSVCSCA